MRCGPSSETRSSAFGPHVDAVATEGRLYLAHHRSRTLTAEMAVDMQRGRVKCHGIAQVGDTDTVGICGEIKRYVLLHGVFRQRVGIALGGGGPESPQIDSVRPVGKPETPGTGLEIEKRTVKYVVSEPEPHSGAEFHISAQPVGPQSPDLPRHRGEIAAPLYLGTDKGIAGQIGDTCGKS